MKRGAVVVAALVLAGCSSGGTRSAPSTVVHIITQPPTSTAPPTSGPGADYAFINAVKDQVTDLGLLLHTNKYLITVAHTICDQLAAGDPAAGIARAIHRSQIEYQSAVTFLRLSIETYCPDQRAKIGE